MDASAEERMEEQEKPQPVVIERSEEKTLLSWTGPIRPFKKRGREFFSTVLAIGVLIGIIFFFIEGLMPVIVVGAVVFLVYILSTVAPENVNYQITNKGIKIGDKNYSWDVMLRFFFTDRWGQDLLIVEMPGVFPGRLELVISGEANKNLPTVEPYSRLSSNKEELKKILLKYMPMEKTPPNFLDKSASWLSKRIPLEG